MSEEHIPRHAIKNNTVSLSHIESKVEGIKAEKQKKKTKKLIFDMVSSEKQSVSASEHP